MKRVIIYGVALLEQRLRIEGALDDDTNIVGYMDSYWEDIGGEKEFEYIPMIEAGNLTAVEYDYIILNVIHNRHIEEITKLLTESGVKTEKIIPFYWFDYIGLSNPVDKYFNVQNKKFDGLVIGMSYALDGFYPSFFRKRFYNAAARGLDLYYYYHILQRIFSYIGTKGELFDNLKYIVLEMPYFILNYDLSKEMQLFRGRISNANALYKWHHALESEEGIIYKKKWEGFSILFGKRLSRQESIFTCHPFSRVIQYQSEEQGKLHNAYIGVHKETMEENKIILRDIMKLIYKFKADIKIAVVVFPFSDRCQEWETIPYQKEQFYLEINSIKEQFPGISIYDCYNLFNAHRDYYYDYSHLNTQGAKAFSEYLNGEFEKTFYR